MCGIFRFRHANDGDINRAEWRRLLGGLTGHLLGGLTGHLRSFADTVPDVLYAKHSKKKKKKKKKKNNVIKLYWVFYSMFFYLTANTRLDVVQNFMLRHVWK